MTQGDLFPPKHVERKPLIPFEPRRPVSATADPDTSRKAEDSLRRSGELAQQCRETLEALAAWTGPAPTSHELAGPVDIQRRYMFGRRLADLRSRGLVETGVARPCGVTGHVALTWEVTAAGREAIRAGG